LKSVKKYAFVFSAICILIFIGRANAQQFNFKVNAMYIYYFTKYINWPENSTKSDITIGVIGSSDVVSELESMTANKKVNGHSLIIRKIEVEEAKNCQVVVVSKSQTGLLHQVEEETKDMPVLIVTEKQGLTSKGAGICIYVDDEDNFKTKIELCKTGMESRGLKISHELLTLAESVK
jgi:hypothetical protein